METALKCTCLVLALCCFFIVDGYGQQWRNKHASSAAFLPKTPSLSNCESWEKTGVHLILQNALQPAYFLYNVTLCYTPKTPLIRYLEQAADKNSHFKFSATYFPGMGYFIDSINGLAGKWDPDQTFWEILNSDLKQIDKGVSSYIPNDGEWLIFNFTKGGH